MQQQFVHALSGFRVSLRLKICADAAVQCAPAGTAIISTIDAPCRQRAVHARRVVWIDNDRVQCESAACGLPGLVAGVFVESGYAVPAFATVITDKQTGRLDTRIKTIRRAGVP